MQKSVENYNKVHFVELSDEDDVGIYIYVYETENSKTPEKDYLADAEEMAKDICLDDFDIPIDAWEEINSFHYELNTAAT